MSSPPFIIWEDEVHFEMSGAKLSDYGLATLRANATPLSSNLRWSAPECLLQRATVASDVHSFAMCLIEIETGELPFAFLDDDDVRHNQRHDEIPNRPSSMRDDEAELVRSMTDSDFGRRVSLDHVIAEMKRLADLAAAATCSVCLSEIATDSRLCSQCGTRVDNTARMSPRLRSVRVNLQAGDNSVAEVLDAVRRGSSDQQQALILLLEICLDDTQRREIYETDGVGALASAPSRPHFVQICALSCLRWISVINSSFPTGELKALKEFIRDVTSDECTSLVNDLRNGGEEEKLKAIVYCAGIAGAKASQSLPNSGVVAVLAQMLTKVSNRRTVWAVDAIANLADNDDVRVAIANKVL